MTEETKKDKAPGLAPDDPLWTVANWLRAEAVELEPKQLQQSLRATWGMDRTQKDIEAALEGQIGG